MTTQMSGRIAMRLEGNWWVAYYALPTTMEGAIELGRIHVKFVPDDPARQTFINIFKNGLTDFFDDQGLEVANWGQRPAPESERGGTA